MPLGKRSLRDVPARRFARNAGVRTLGYKMSILVVTQRC
jgi:hypothetical protein